MNDHSILKNEPIGWGGVYEKRRKDVINCVFGAFAQYYVTHNGIFMSRIVLKIKQRALIGLSVFRVQNA